MRITLIQPPKPTYGSEAEKHWQLARPFSLFFLASYLEKHTQFEVDIVDLEHRRFRHISLEDVFHQNESSIFGITATTFTRFEAVTIAKLLKAKFPNSLVVVGGVHFMYCAEETLTRVPEIDVVVRGEGEITFTELATAFSNGDGFSRINGITYRNNGNIFNNEDSDIFEDLDSLPIYSKFSWDEYPEYLFGYPDEIRAVSIMSSRGCPYNCVFCSKAGMKYRVRNAKSVVDEIELLKNKFGIEGINFLDLTFTADPRHVRAVCNEIISRKLSIKWWCESRVNIPLDLLDIMKQSGCVSMVLGIESGSKSILSAIKKNISIDHVLSFCQKCSELGIKAQPYFMFSHPGETMDDVKLTIDLILRLEKMPNIGSCAFQPTIIYPGTQIEKLSHTKDILKKNFSWYDPYHSDFNKELGQMTNIPIYIDELKPKDLIQAYNTLLLGRTVGKAVEMDFKELIVKGVKAIARNHTLIRILLSPRFYFKYFANKYKSKNI